MDQRALGNSGLQLSCIGLGAMPLSLDRRPDEATAISVIHAALDAGMTLIDTADVYCIDNNDIGHNERLIAKALGQWSGNADGVVVATKGGLERPGGDWTANGRPDHLKRACERSLAALDTDCIDLYQLHAPDGNVPFADSVGALADLRQAGKIRHVGLSNVNTHQIDQARSIVEVVSVQNRCNLFDRQSFRNGVVTYCEENNIAFLPYSPVGGHFGHVQMTRQPLLKKVAERRGASTYQICLAWLLQISSVMIPIPGASRVESVISSGASARLRLEPEEISLLAGIP